MKRWRLPTVLVLAVVIAGCNACGILGTGSATLKAQSAAIDTVKVIGLTAKLVSGPADNICGKGAAPVAVCDGWYHFFEGKAPLVRVSNRAVLADPAACDGGKGAVEGRCRFKRADPADDALCALPTVANVLTVYDRCGFRDTYPFVFREYLAKKDIAAGVASVIESMTRNLVDFGGKLTGK